MAWISLCLYRANKTPSTMKGSFVLLGMGVAALTMLACSKNDIHVNAEKNFTLFFVGRDSLLEDTCFDSVYAVGHGPLMTCSNYDKGFGLPLNIGADTSRFYFMKAKRVDTLTIVYSRRYEGGGTEFETIYTITQIKTSFDSLTTRCTKNFTNNTTQNCNGEDAHLSATIIY